MAFEPQKVPSGRLRKKTKLYYGYSNIIPDNFPNSLKPLSILSTLLEA